jgi:hypothetical protein
MPLPASRDYTATEGGPLPPEVINNLQDAVVDHEERISAEKTLNVPAGLAKEFGGGGATVSNGHITAAGINVGGTWVVPLHAGDRVRAIRVRVDANTAGDLAALVSSVSDPTGTGITSIATTDSRSTVGDLEQAGIDHTLAEGEVLLISVSNTAGAGSVRFKHLRVDYDHPA